MRNLNRSRCVWTSSVQCDADGCPRLPEAADRSEGRSQAVEARPDQQHPEPHRRRDMGAGAGEGPGGSAADASGAPDARGLGHRSKAGEAGAGSATRVGAATVDCAAGVDAHAPGSVRRGAHAVLTSTPWQGLVRAGAETSPNQGS